MSFDTPILFLVFNRPDVTKIVFEKIRKQKPKYLFIAADGPRILNNEDEENCLAVKEIFNEIDWDCELKTLYRIDNLGCKNAVSSAIDWFFDQVEEGIILEDDILPDDSFFPFCSKMLEHYRSDEKVMHISGFNVCGTWKEKKQSYHFSYFGGIWGWASWRRAWKHYDVNILDWNDKQLQNNILEKYFPKEMRVARKNLYDDLYNGKINTWDYQWTFARLIYNGMSVIPSKNLVINIGFNIDATHTSVMPEWILNHSFSMKMPMSIQRNVICDKKYDEIHLMKSSGIKNRNYLMLSVQKYFKNIYNEIRNS